MKSKKENKQWLNEGGEEEDDKLQTPAKEGLRTALP